MTGPLNVNGQNLTGVANFSAATIAATSSITSPTYNGTTVAVTGTITGNTIQSNNGRIISENSANNPSVNVWDTSQNFAAGMYLAASDTLAFGAADGTGNPTGGAWAAMYSGGLSVPGTITAGALNVTGAMQAANITANGSLAVGSGGANFYGPVGFNSQNVSGVNSLGVNAIDCGELIVGTSSGIYTIGPINMNGQNIINCPAVIPPSDLRFKTNVAPAVIRGLDVLSGIALQQFTMAGKHYDIGFIANDLPDPLHGIQSTRQGDYHYVEMLSLLAALTDAVQELNARVAAVESRRSDPA